MLNSQFDQFEDKEGDTQLTMCCKSCNETFDIDFDLLTPKNVFYTMGENMCMTVTCPNCQAYASVDQREYDCMRLESIKEAMEEELGLLLAETDIKFTIVENKCTKTSATFHCLSCENEFEARSRKHKLGPLNVSYDDAEDFFSVTCPNCHEADEIGKHNNAARTKISVLSAALAEVRQKMSTLCNDEDEDEDEDDETRTNTFD